MSKRMKLKLLRVANDLTQREMAEKIGVPRETYVCIENRTRNGKPEFWDKFQCAFGIPDDEMWGYVNDGQTGRQTDNENKVD